jgi:flagellar protein FliS
MQAKGIQSYRRTSVITADPKRLVLMCYEGAIDNLKIGKQKIMEKDYEGKCKALIKAQDIINELLCSLSFEKGGVIAKNLHSLYSYMLQMIMHVQLKKDIKALEDVIGMLEELKSAWEDVFCKQGENVKPRPVEFYEDRRQVSGYAGLQG